MKRLRRIVKKIAEKRKHYFGRLWHWALKPEYAGKRRRLKVLAAWARDHWQMAKDKRQHGRAHKFWKARRAYARKRRLLKKHHRKHPQPGPTGGNMVVWDGHQVPRWIVEEALRPARASGMWVGVVFSGYRTPEASEAICIQQCGQVRCPGTCAGRATNHACPPTYTGVPFEGAIDVSDSYGLMRWEAAHGYPIRHTLPYDLPHHSRSGQ